MELNRKDHFLRRLENRTVEWQWSEAILNTHNQLILKGEMVGASRFERPTSRTPSECAIQTALRPDC